MSQSFGIPEIFIHANNAQVLQAERNYLEAQAQGITVLASAGDSGGSNGSSIANALFPASNPLNTAVGGTMGDPYLTAPSSFSCPGVGQICSAGLATVKGPCTLTSGRCTEFGYGGEQVWNEVRFGAATGGAPSLFFPVPSFQSGLGLTSRTTPDVSYNAAINGGVLVAWSALAPAGSFFIVGGTSAGAPQWAGIVALANQKRAAKGFGPLGFLNPALYAVAASASYASAFHDITVGNNKLGGTLPGFSAGAGYDAASGWGTPNVANLINALAP
jgi:subtilase family serine protease